MVNNDNALKKQLNNLLTKANSHATFFDATAGLTTDVAGQKIEGLPYTIWQVIEHIRIAQWDMLQFSMTPEHSSPAWPDGYWPNNKAPKNEAALKGTINQVNTNLNEFLGLVEDEQADLYGVFAHGTGQNLLKEAFMIADHTAYHTGEIVAMRRLLGDWK